MMHYLQRRSGYEDGSLSWTFRYLCDDDLLGNDYETVMFEELVNGTATNLVRASLEASRIMGIWHGDIHV